MKFLPKKKQRVATVFVIGTVLGFIISAFALHDLGNSAYHDIGYVSFDELCAVFWLMGFSIYLLALAGFGLVKLFFFAIAKPVHWWVSRGEG